MGDIRSFELDLDRFSRQMGIGLETALRKFTLDLFSDVVRLTPVKTGYARQNWFISFGQRSFAIPAGDRKKFLPTTAQVAGSKAIGNASLKMTSYRQSKSGGFQIIYMQNNVPYIGRLEAGSSEQAPAGMVARTLTEYRRRFDRYVRHA